MIRNTILGLAACLTLLASPAFAQVKISSLPDAHLPLVGGEVVPIVQDETTRKVRVSSLLAAAANALQPQNNLSDVDSAAASRTNLGVAIGSNVEAWDADLDAIAALSGTNTIYYRSGANTWTPVTIGGNLTFSGGTLNGAAAGVTATGTPANGNLTKFSGASSVTSGDLSGDCVTSGTLATVCTKTNGVAFAASATTNTTSASNISSGTLAAARGGAGTVSGILQANGSGVVSAVTVGTGLSFSAGTLSATGGSGTVTTTGTPATGNLAAFSGSTSITNSNLSGDCTTSGALAVTCTKTSGVSFGTAATASTGTSGATLPLLNAANTWSATQTHNPSATLAMVTSNIGEPVTVSATAATGTINFDAITQSVVYYTSNASANWTLNLRGSSTTSMNTLLATGQAITLTHLVTQGASAFYNNVVQVDGTTSGVTTKWQGGAPAAGNASGVDVYTYTIIKTGSAAFTVLASQTPFN